LCECYNAHRLGTLFVVADEAKPPTSHIKTHKATTTKVGKQPPAHGPTDRFGISYPPPNLDGTQLSRIFKTKTGERAFKGRVTTYSRYFRNEHLWTVDYEDGDQEELNYAEITALKIQDAPPEKKKTTKIAVDIQPPAAPSTLTHQGVRAQPGATRSFTAPVTPARASVGAYGCASDTFKAPVAKKPQDLPFVNSPPTVNKTLKAPTGATDAANTGQKLVTKHALEFYFGGFTGYLTEDHSEGPYSQPLKTSNLAVIFGVDLSTNCPAAIVSKGQHRDLLSKNILGAAGAGSVIKLMVDKTKGRERESLMRPVVADRDIYDFGPKSDVLDVDTNQPGLVRMCWVVVAHYYRVITWCS
jgi:hypothetical protein